MLHVSSGNCLDAGIRSGMVGTRSWDLMVGKLFIIVLVTYSGVYVLFFQSNNQAIRTSRRRQSILRAFGLWMYAELSGYLLAFVTSLARTSFTRGSVKSVLLCRAP